MDEESRAGGFEADGFGEAQHKENDESSPYGGIVRFVLEWPEVAEPVFTSDLGYRVELERAFIGVNRMQLVPCESETAALWSWMIPEVLAGHPGELHSSGFLKGALETLVPFGRLVLPDVEGAEGAVCEAHILYAETPEFAVGVETELVGVSLLLEGVWHSEWGMSSAFRLESNLANGVVLSSAHRSIWSNMEHGFDLFGRRRDC